MTPPKSTIVTLLCRSILAFGLLAAVTVAAPATAYSDPSNSDEVDLSDVDALADQVIPEQLEDGQIPGAVVTVVADGEVAYSKGYGDANITTKTTMDAHNTEFYAASEAKLFAATAALQLVAQHKLDLNADVNDYLKSMSVPDTYPGQPITVHNLLTFTSGFDYNVYGWSQWDAENLPSLQGFASKMQPERVREPGKLVAYNNYDFVLLGCLIEAVSGHSYSDYVEKHVFKPLGMDSSSVAQPHPAKLEAKLANNYRPDGASQTATQGQTSPVTPAGGNAITSADDMANFMIAQLDHSDKLGPQVAKLMQQQQFAANENVPGMGYAFEQRPRNGQNVLFKDGDLPGIHHNLALLPDSNVGIHIVYNGDGNDQAAFWGGKEFINQFVDHYFPGKTADNKPTPADVSQYAGTYESDRSSRSSFARVETLTAPVTVKATGNGTITTEGLSENPAVTTQQWQQTAKGVFHLTDGDETLAFNPDGTLVVSQMPSAAFVPLSWYDSPTLHMAVMGVAILILLLAFFWLPIMALTRRISRRESHQPAAKFARLAAWFTCLCVVMFIAGFAIVSADPNRLMQLPLTGDPILSIALNTVSVMAVFTLAIVIAAAVSWLRRWWTLKGRIGYATVSLAAMSFMWIAIHYSLIGVPYTLTV